LQIIQAEIYLSEELLMAGGEFQGIGFRDFSGGIDALSSEDHIKDGYVQELVNMEPTPEGYVRKRKGYQRIFGSLPLRAKRRSLSGTTLTITFETAYSILDFTNVPRLPVFIVGRRSSTSELVYSSYAQITGSTTNTITVTAGAGTWANVDDLALTVWGIDLDDVIVPSASSETVKWPMLLGEFTDIQDRQEMLAVFQGTIYQTLATRLPSYMSANTFYNFPTTTTSFNLTVSGALRNGPAFYPSLATPVRTRGYIKADEVSDGHTLHASAAEWQSGTGYVKYTIPTTNGVLSGTPILADFDYLTCSGAGSSLNNGTFLIKVVDTSTIASGYISLHVENADRDSSDFDETSAGIEVGIFTDRVISALTWANTHLIPGDKLFNAALVDTSYGDPVMENVSDAWEVYGFGSGAVWVSNVRKETVTTGITFTNYRTSPLLMISATSNSTTAFVARDVISLGGKLYSVRHWFLPAILPAYSAVALGDGTVEITPSSGTLNVHREGGYIYLKGSVETSSFQGIYEIESLDSSTGKFIVTNEDFTGSEALTSRLYNLEIDRSVEHTGASAVTVPTRWYPVEPFNSLFVPNTSLTQNLLLTEERAFSQVAKKDLTPNDSITADGSTLVCGEYSPLVKVFPRSATSTDLVHLHAGLPRWQAKCNIVNDAVTAGGVLAAGVYTYYFRLEYVDRSGNTHISAPSLQQATAAATSRMELKLITPPSMYYLDVNNVYLRVFRTIAGGAVFYQAYVVDLLKNSTYLQYVSLTDNLSDALLVLGGADAEMLALNPTDLVTTLDTPPGAKYITALDNRTVLGNIQPPHRFRLSCEYPTTLTAAGLTQCMLSFVPGGMYELTNTTSQAITGITQGATSAGKTSYRIQTGGGAALNAGIWIQLVRLNTVGANAFDPYLAGWHKVVTAVNTGDFTIQIDEAAVPPPAGAVSNVDLIVFPTDLLVAGAVPVWLGVDYFMGDTLGNTSASIDLNTVVLSRLARAINATQAEGQLKGEIYASHGADIDANLRTMHIWAGAKHWGTDILCYFTNRTAAPSISSPFYIDDVYLETAPVTVSPKRFPSRLAISYQGKGETFDATHYSNPANSASLIDINPEDGQEITGLISFFGESTSGSATKEATLIVAKERSFYTVNISTGDIQRLETRNLGCEAPETLQSTSGGIMFANRSGIFKLNKGYGIDDVGQFSERVWEENLNVDAVANCSAFHSTFDRSYAVSYPIDSDEAPSAGLTYWYRKESRGSIGAWSTVTNIPALRWRAWQGGEYFAGPNGQIYKIRRDKAATDYADDGDAIDAHILTRPESFGSVSSRKHVPNFRVSFRNVVGRSEGTTVQVGEDTEVDLLDTDAMTLDDGTSLLDNLGDVTPRRIEVLQFSVPEPRCNFIQVKVSNAELEEDLQVTEVSYTVEGLPVGKGHRGASDT
jgi:hypothetical protein